MAFHFSFTSSQPTDKRPRLDHEQNGSDLRGDASISAGDGSVGNGSSANQNGLNEAAQIPEMNLIKPLASFVKFITWEKADAEYYLRVVRGRKIMTEEDENDAMAQILRSFVETNQPVS